MNVVNCFEYLFGLYKCIPFTQRYENTGDCQCFAIYIWWSPHCDSYVCTFSSREYNNYVRHCFFRPMWIMFVFKGGILWRTIYSSSSVRVSELTIDPHREVWKCVTEWYAAVLTYGPFIESVQCVTSTDPYNCWTSSTYYTFLWDKKEWLCTIKHM